MKKILITLIIFLNVSCNNKTQNKIVTVDGINFLIPSGFKLLKPDKEVNEILKIALNNDMYIVVQNDLGDVIKQNPEFEDYAFDMVHLRKFGMMKKNYNGYNISMRSVYKINGRKVSEQGFLSKANVGDVYYKYFLVETSNNFLEVILSGKLDLKPKQEKIIKEFIENIDYKPTEQVKNE